MGLAVDTALAIATTHALAFLKLPSTSPTSMVSPSRWNGLVPTVLAVLAPVASPGRGQLMVSVTRKLGRAPTRTWSAATNKSVNAVIRVFAIALLDSVLVSLATGSSCQRTACPDDCSGHGTCRSNRDFAYDWAIAKTTQIQSDDTGDRFTELFKETYFASYDDAWDTDMHY